ncbi:uncharacterized protein LOC110704379 [Chenopodium quinoa]|uniref:uncharacterized protein LOC110704379 n=1 Tax=Chenopodium quinoa TaxID=63459 RepID=UPI000B79792F|nr:uncharacterized protein LOC110704379 [Chenopodium quinoa]
MMYLCSFAEVVRLLSEKAPAHCILKIDSFSELQDAYVSRKNKDYLESTEFSVGGFTWMLSVCPKRNEPEQGDEHLSVYVTLVDKLEPGSLVDVVLRFFVHDHLRDAYLSVLDVRERRFHALKDKWGVPKFVPISTFNDADYGFLVDDCCVFGAEVLVINNQQVKISTMSIVEEKSVKSYTWRIESFQSLSKRLSSPRFCFNGWSWKLVLHPRGQSNAKGKHLSLFLRLDNNSGLTHGNKLYVEYFLYLKNQRKEEDHYRLGRNWYSASSDSWGFSTFLSLCDLHDNSKSYQVDDTIITEVHIQKMILLKDNMASVKQEKLNLYARGNKEEKGKSLSLYLHLDTKLTHGNKLYVKFILYLKNQCDGKDHQKFVAKWLTASNEAWGYHAFFSLESPHDSSNGYLLGDTIIVEVCIKKMFMLKDMDSLKEE